MSTAAPSPERTALPPGEPEAARAVPAAVPPWAVAALLGLLYVVLEPLAGDLPAQTYRVWHFEQEGPSLYDTAWYGGHHMPGYSLLFPPLGALLGVFVVGALSAVASAWAFARLVEEQVGRDAWPGALLFAIGTASTLLAGRLTFALGIAVGLTALLAATRGRPVLAAALAVLTAAASPVAAAFLAMAAVAWWLVTPRRSTLVLAAAALAPVLALGVAFPDGGEQPMLAETFWRTLVTALVVLWALPARERVLRTATALYALATIASFLLDTPMGSNVVRLGALVGAPLVLAVLLARRPRLAVVLALPLVVWQWEAPVADWWGARGDPLFDAREYAPLVALLDERRRTEGPFRVEVPFTANHAEADLLAREFPLARGWQRQLDVKVNGLFYDEGPLRPTRYLAWLRDNAVRYVALPTGVALDRSAREEARLLRDGRVPALGTPARAGRWRVWSVPGAAPLADGARVVRLDRDRVTLDAPRAGRVLVRTRYTRYWRIVEGAGCVERGREGWTALRLTRPGRVVLATTFAPGRVVSSGPRCTR